MLDGRRYRVEHDLRIARKQAGKGSRRTTIWHVQHVDAGHDLEQLAGEMLRAPDAGRGHVDLALIGPRISDEFGNGLGRNRWNHLHDEGRAGNACDWCDVADEIEFEIAVQCRVPRVYRSDQEQRIAVGRRTYDRLGADIAAGTRPALDDELLAEPLREPLADQASDDVGAAAGRKADDDAHRPGRIEIGR